MRTFLSTTIALVAAGSISAATGQVAAADTTAGALPPRLHTGSAGGPAWFSELCTC
jgi:hypothetical protein